MGAGPTSSGGSELPAEQRLLSSRIALTPVRTATPDVAPRRGRSPHGSFESRPRGDPDEEQSHADGRSQRGPGLAQVSDLARHDHATLLAARVARAADLVHDHGRGDDDAPQTGAARAQA